MKEEGASVDLIFPLLVVVVIAVNVDGVVDGGDVGVSALFSSGLTLSVVDETSLLGGDGEEVVVLRREETGDEEGFYP